VAPRGPPPIVSLLRRSHCRSHASIPVLHAPMMWRREKMRAVGSSAPLVVPSVVQEFEGRSFQASPVLSFLSEMRLWSANICFAKSALKVSWKDFMATPICVAVWVAISVRS
jgi:hypothetical protein